LESQAAVVLERIAMGAGSTRWYYCRKASQLGAIEARLRPGSVVSFYFDKRIRSAAYSPEVKPEMLNIIDRTRDVVVGLLSEDQLELHVDFVTSAGELDELTNRLDPKTQVFYGAFPSRDNDGIDAVTVVLPDVDGIVRAHPH